MANNLIISYDLYSSGQNYDAVAKVIKGLGTWAKVQYSLWYVNSSLSASDAVEAVRTAIDENDSIIVIDATNNNAAWYNLKEEVSDFLKKNWQT